MSDGLNQARAMRVAEIITDYRNIQQRISQIRASPSAEEYNEVGFLLLRQCESEARTLLNQPFASPVDNGERDEEQVKLQLRRIIVDASVRRFKVQRNLMRMAAALKWIQLRATVLDGAKPNSNHGAALAQCTQILRQDLTAITDTAIEAGLRRVDTQAGKWMAEDPPLAVLQRFIAA